MAKANSVFICIFTDVPPIGGGYDISILPAQERSLYNAASNAATELFQHEGLEGTNLSLCYAKSPEFSNAVAQMGATPPFAAIGGTFPDGSKKAYTTKNPVLIKQYIKAMWTGEFGGTGLPVNVGDGDGGWGQGDSILCELFPPFCALGFLPWLALSAYTTYRAVESRSTAGKTMWGVPAFLFWQGFFARGGVKQIQYLLKKI